jgi:hypothetical protein
MLPLWAGMLPRWAWHRQQDQHRSQQQRHSRSEAQQHTQQQQQQRPVAQS